LLPAYWIWARNTCLEVLFCQIDDVRLGGANPWRPLFQLYERHNTSLACRNYLFCIHILLDCSKSVANTATSLVFMAKTFLKNLLIGTSIACTYLNRLFVFNYVRSQIKSNPIPTWIVPIISASSARMYEATANLSWMLLFAANTTPNARLTRNATKPERHSLAISKSL
jgi:hypothetical protein